MSPALLYDSLAICAFWAFLLRSLANIPEILQLIGLKKWKNLKTTKDSCHCHWEYEIPVILDDIIHEPMSINFHELKQELLMLWVQQKSDVPSKFLHDLAGSRVLHWRFAPGDPKWNQTTSWTGVFSSQLALGFVLIIPPPQRKVSVVFALKKERGPSPNGWFFVLFFGGCFLLPTPLCVGKKLPAARPWIQVPKLMDIQLKVPIRWRWLVSGGVWLGGFLGPLFFEKSDPGDGTFCQKKVYIYIYI